MEFVPMIIMVIIFAIAYVVYPKRDDTFVEIFKLKGDYKSFELEIRTKQKNDPPRKK